MGVPVSSVFANLVIEDVEKRALETVADPHQGHRESRSSRYPCPLGL